MYRVAWIDFLFFQMTKSCPQKKKFFIFLNIFTTEYNQKITALTNQSPTKQR